MNLVNRDSLAATLDTINEAFFSGQPPSGGERQEAARWIAGRQGLPRAYAAMFAPTPSDFAEGVRLFTGERVRSGAGIGHILGEEACRALLLLRVSDSEVNGALERASHGMLSRLATSPRPAGMYCCRTCTPALWRHLAAGGLNDAEERLTAGMKTLKSNREGNGRWSRFPFYYTLLAVSEIDLPPAREEMRHAAPACERYLKRSASDETHDRRRRSLAETVLARC